MGPEVVAAIVGPVAGAMVGIFAFISKRNMVTIDSQIRAISAQVSEVSDKVTELHITLPSKYVTKEELLRHIQGEEYFHNKFLSEMRDLRDEVITIRAYYSNSKHDERS